MAPIDFKGKRAFRFERAMARFPNVRAAEVLAALPLIWPASTRSEIAIDLGAGPGYLSKVLESLYGQVIRIDRSADMLGIDNPAVIADFGDEEAADALVDLDLVASLAAFHHLYILRGGAVDREASERAQNQSICNWAARLRQGGRIVVIDVEHGEPAVAGGYQPSMGAQELAEVSASVPEYELDATLKLFDVNLQDRGLTFDSLIRGYASAGVSPNRIDPAKFFDSVVNNYNPEGHPACFLSRERLTNAMLGAGLSDVQVGTLLTPWIFHDLDDLIGFVCDLFGLSLVDGSAQEIVDRLRPEVFRGQYVVAWRLLFGIGTKP